jgi:hypothetical protein
MNLQYADVTTVRREYGNLLDGVRDIQNRQLELASKLDNITPDEAKVEVGSLVEMTAEIIRNYEP